MLHIMKLDMKSNIRGMGLIIFGALFAISIPMSVFASEVCSTQQQVVVSDASNHVGSAAAVATYQSSLWTSIPGAEWIWKTYLVESPAVSETATFSKSFEVVGSPASSTLSIAGDDYFKVYVNGTEIASELGEGNFLTVHDYALDPTLFHSGINEIQVEVTNAKYFYGEGATAYSNPAGVTYAFKVTSQTCIQSGNGGQGKLLNPDPAPHASGSLPIIVSDNATSAQNTEASVPQVEEVSGLSASNTESETETSASVKEETIATSTPIVRTDTHHVWQKVIRYFLFALIAAMLLLIAYIIMMKKGKETS